MTSLQYVRQRGPQEEKADALATLEAAAGRGEGPDTFKADDVLWAVGGDQAVIDRLAATAAAAREERARRYREQHAREELRHMTDAVLAEWQAAEQAERRERAETEARRRLEAANA